MAWFTTTGYLAWGRCPARPSTSSSAPASRARLTPRANGWHRSWVPWTTRTGQEIAASVSATAVWSSPTKSAFACEIITSPSVWQAQSTTSS
jgi:hypothetical protein